ncbi:unnamed protein product [Calicophoron daubneyi]|uniref:PX domain-containing protein n=1 Tax=Calicophoron daubneyi TaxID=300641 RepID=A0AAV2TID3_CALDB
MASLEEEYAASCSPQMYLKQNPNHPDTSLAKSDYIPFEISIPSVNLRKHRKFGTYFVYMIKIRVFPNSRTARISDLPTEIHHAEWIVGRRYTTLEKLHLDLMGKSEEEEGEEKQKESESSNSETESLGHRYYAHPCLPRPLPGLNSLCFPKRRLLPTIPVLEAGFSPICGAIPFESHESDEYADCVVPANSSRRVEERRVGLENYLNNLVRLVWQAGQILDVANVYIATVGTEKADRPDRPRSALTAHSDSTQDSIMNLKIKLLDLIPVFSPEWRTSR